MTVVLTTHSMEECEAVCTRVGIMRKGQLCALGSVQLLKEQYGEGFFIELQVQNTQKLDR